MRTLHRVLVFPAWTANPYLNLLSLAPRASGYEFDGATLLDSLLAKSRSLAPQDVLHIHWTSSIIQREITEEDARSALRRFEVMLDELRARSVHVVWTVHNQLPHELVHRDAEIALYRLLAERADAIHIMSPATVEILSGICTLPGERVRVIPHPSYLGVYGAPPARLDARRALGLDDDTPAVLFLGQMRPYKGLGTLLAAMRRLAEEDRPLPVLLLAGSATPDLRAEIHAGLPERLRVIARYEFIPDEEVGTWFAAADLAVFPYTAILNSGSLHLSAAFEVPAMLPNEPHLVEQFGGEPWVSFFDLADPVTSMAGQIRQQLVGGGRDQLISRFDAFNDAVSPWRISRRYAGLLDEVVATVG
ncbi:glycosyltransferase [Agromyces sp. NPDC058104]|uniref:glycosyltransferase n=1 Tax=Agromyces sp. NPDC058104 TaxID=3346342 RepID=UPI0036DBC2B9